MNRVSMHKHFRGENALLAGIIQLALAVDESREDGVNQADLAQLEAALFSLIQAADDLHAWGSLRGACLSAAINDLTFDADGGTEG